MLCCLMGSVNIVMVITGYQGGEMISKKHCCLLS